MRHFFHFIFFNVKQPEESHEDTPTRVGNLEDCQLADLSNLPLRIASESLEMCFYDVNEMQCCCWKWGHFRQHCAKEYRTGETCGMKLVMNRYQLPEKCKICTKIDTKERMMRKGEERIRRWQKEGMGSMGKNRNDSQLLGGEPRVTEQEWRLWESADTQADQLKNAWHDVEKMKDELESLLEERVRKRYQREITESDDSDLEGSPPPSTTIEGQFTSLRLDSPGGVSSTNVSGFATKQKGKVGEPNKNSPPAPRFFPIDASKDATLIFSWQEKVLPKIKPLLCDSQDISLSITLLRQGISMEDSIPVARIQTSNPRPKERQIDIVSEIERILVPVPSPRVFFVVGSIKRTARKSDLDRRPCTARNIAFLKQPPMGVSIGLEGSVKDTATLGGYIYLDGIPHILTVHHLFTDDDSGEVFRPGTAITQPSLQEVKELGDMLDRLKASGDCFHIECVKNLLENMKACLPEFSFGQLERSSGYRNRPSREGSSNVEMDWAICKVDKRRVGSNISPCQNHHCQGISAVTPGGAVFAIGRTSGQQSGNINGDKSYLLLRDDDGDYRVSEEWAILRPESQEEDTWVTNGIGVSGDSGAWILEQGTDNLIGQLWGRDFQEGNGNDGTGEIITYFTPTLDMFDDIRQSTGAIEISISSNGRPNKEDKQKGKEKVILH